MAKTKVYFWLKIDKKFFDNIFIKRLKTVPGGYTMTVIYIRLMLESLDSDCILYYEGYFESLKEELALKLDVSEDDIDMTMAYFTKCGLIQIDEDKNAELPQAKAMVMSETNWASYKREQRQNKEKLDNVQKSLTNSNSRPTEIEIEIEKDIKLDIDLDINKEIHFELDNSAEQSSAYVFPNWLNRSSIEELKKVSPKNYHLYIPIQYLNQETGHTYKFIATHTKFIQARYKDGYTLEDFKKVIDTKVAQWKNNSQMAQYLRPKTLFSPSNFDSYLNEAPKPIQVEQDNMDPLPF
ncbi:TPA: conserved phage C-terminal domain-containing protein [Streptococcus suis]|nr:conserved phage C-terminal domain-containing protein [Streptococcus suis]HEL2321487.1 conserved phage C-terminal domain-containing protein [Streptococcus suis]